MNNIIAFISIMLIVSAGGCSRSTQQNGHSHADQAGAASAGMEQKEMYTCPMHPSVVSDKPGACPICGMSLVKRQTMQNVSAGEIEDLKSVSLSPAQRVMANVSTEPVRRLAFEHKVNAVGLIDYAEPNQAKVSARFRGRIEKLYVNFTGEVVRRGQPLFEMYSPELVSAQREYILALNAANPEPASMGRDDQQESLLAAARERLRIHYGMTQQQIEAISSKGESGSTITFYSPIHGTVVSKDVQEGQYVDEGMLLYQLADLSRVWAYLDVYEKNLRFIKRGQTVRMKTEAYPGESFTGRVAFIDPALDAQTRTVRIRVDLDNAGGKLKPQMYVQAEVSIPVPNSLVIPSSALLSTGKRDVVWIETKPNVFEPRNVVVGATDGSRVQILEGLHEGEMVAAKGGYMLDSESQLHD